MPNTFYNIVERSAPQIPSAAPTAWISLRDKLPKSASIELTWVASSAVVARVEYSQDGTTIAAQGQSTTALTDAGTVRIVLPISAAYQFVRVRWQTGTATSLNTKVLMQILGS